MAQPSVAAYFNTRKRVAADDIKINRARKVLIVDEGNGKLSQQPSEVEAEKMCAVNESEKLVPNKIINKVDTALTKKVSRMRSATPKRTVSCKGQQDIQKFITVIPGLEDKNESDKIAITVKEHLTPPASPVKTSNAMDKVSQIPSLDAVKTKLSRSSRLAELKASMTRFNESHKKLTEIQKVTSNISVTSKESPKLKSFKSLELEVNLSPQKVQSPEKLYLSPKKDATARKNLLNLLSPTKNAVPLTLSPSKKIYELTSKPALTLPFKYRYVAEMFRAIDTICQLLFNRKETITFTKLKPAVEKMTKRNMSTRSLAQIKQIYPDAFKFQQEKLRVFGNGKREEKWELVITPSVGDNETMTGDILLTRKRILFDLLMDKVKNYHNEFLLSLEPPMAIPKNKITRWHPEFDIERIPDLEESALPQPPIEQKLTTGQEVLERAREMFNCNNRMEQALERLKAKQEETAPKVEDNVPPTSILKGIPKALLEKVRQKQAANALISMTRSADKEKELQVYSRLPELARLLRNLFVSENKGVLPFETVVEKLGNCYKVTLSKSEMEEHIKLLAKEVPEWVMIVDIRKTRFVKIPDRHADISIHVSKLENLTKTKSEN